MEHVACLVEVRNWKKTMLLEALKGRYSSEFVFKTGVSKTRLKGVYWLVTQTGGRLL
jgi:hypothetical protein